MAFKATKYFVLIVAIVIGGTRYMNTNMKRYNFNNDVGVWDTEAKDGLRYTVVTRSNETNGQYAFVNAYCTAKAQGFYKGKPGSLPIHYRVKQVAEFRTLSGKLMLDVNGTEVRIPIGEAVAIPPGMPHTFWNGGEEPLEFTLRLTPGTPDESFLENIGGLSHQYGSLSKVNPIQLLLLFAENDIVPVDVPAPIWDAATKVLVPLAKAMGFKARYSEYTTKAGQPLPVSAPAAEAAPAVPAAEAAATEAAAPAPEPVVVEAESSAEEAGAGNPHTEL